MHADLLIKFIHSFIEDKRCKLVAPDWSPRARRVLSPHLPQRCEKRFYNNMHSHVILYLSMKNMHFI